MIFFLKNCTLESPIGKKVLMFYYNVLFFQTNEIATSATEQRKRSRSSSRGTWHYVTGQESDTQEEVLLSRNSRRARNSAKSYKV